jgi:two-component system, cell cycle response regulator
MGVADLARELDAARAVYWEDPAGSLAAAVRAREEARSLARPDLESRALALAGAVSLHRGDLRGAFELAVEAEPLAAGDAAHVEVAGLKAHLSFFSGSYADALREAERAVEHADRDGGLDLRIFARRAACLVFGNLGVAEWPEQLAGLLEMTVAAGDRWQEAISRNDLACHLQEIGDPGAAEAEMQRGLAVAHTLPAERNRFALGVLHSTRADIGLVAGRPGEALADAEQAIARLLEGGEPNPYVFGVTVRAEVQALLALGRFDDAQRSGEGALERLGERVPQARSMILATIAEALREAGRLEEAFAALSRSSELEREALRELSQLQLSLERATHEARAARREAEQLREQAERDWLTGLHNRRFLARELERMALEPSASPFSLAVLDLDHFKAVNDRFGHETGDRVLVRVAALLLGELRQTDVVVRTGGEEFVVLMPRTGANAALVCCERLRAAICTEPWDEMARGLAVTASVGVATADRPEELAALSALADRRLYAAKRAGRDRVAAAA